MSHARLEIVSESSTTQVPFKHGVEGNLQTLSVMAGMVRRDSADLELRALARRIIRGVREHDYRGEAEAIFEWTRDFGRYVQDPLGLGEKVQSAKATLKFEAGDCGDFSVLLSTLLATIGCPSRFVVLSFQLPAFQHVFCEIKPKGSPVWISADPTPDRKPIGWEGKSLLRKTYPIFDKGDPNDPTNLGWINFAIQAGMAAAPMGLFSRSQQRSEEATRDAWKEQAYNELATLINAVNADPPRIDGFEAVAQARRIVDAYYAAIAGFAKQSVRQSAENFREAFRERISWVQAAADKQRERQQIAARQTQQQIVAAVAGGIATPAATSGAYDSDLLIDPKLLIGGAAAVLLLARMSR